MRNCALRAARMGKHKQHKQHPPVVKDESESDIDASDLDLDDFAEYVATLPESGDDKEKFLRNFIVQKQWAGKSEDHSDLNEAEMRAAEKEYRNELRFQSDYNLRFENEAKAKGKDGNQTLGEDQSKTSQQLENQPPIKSEKQQSKSQDKQQNNKQSNKLDKKHQNNNKQDNKRDEVEHNTAPKKRKAEQEAHEGGAEDTADNEGGKKRKQKKGDAAEHKPKKGRRSKVIAEIRTQVSEEQIEALLNQDFDPDEYDKQMDAIFNEQYYDQGEDSHPYPAEERSK